MEKALALFEQKEVRKIWHDEKWYFSVVDVVGILDVTGREPRKYWSDLKQKMIAEWYTEVSEKIGQLKVLAPDGKMRLTDCADTETLLRIIQSIPSPRAEPFKRWLAKVGNERIQEISDPERALNRSRELWKKHGRSEKWIQGRMSGQETRNKLTDYWSEHGVEKGNEFSILTNIIHEEWTGLKVGEHKDLKWLSKTHNLRDHMSEAELLFTALAELSTRGIAENMKSEGLKDNKIPAKKWGKIARDARIALEEKIGKNVVTGDNFLPPKKDTKKLL